MVGGKERKQITAFIVDVDTPGLEITYRAGSWGCVLLQRIVSHRCANTTRNIISRKAQG